MICRLCGALVERVFVDLRHAPASNSFLTATQLHLPETYFPLRVMVCDSCRLAQIDEYKAHDEIFNAEYVYFSSYSHSWVQHARTYVDHVVERLGLHRTSQVVEIASNDGYLLQWFVKKGIPCLGIEPAKATAAAAEQRGVESWTVFFGRGTANRLVRERGPSDLIVGNNVLAHVPDLLDFCGGLALALAPAGTITLEFPHLLRLLDECQFDTIYQEHFSYLSLHTAARALGTANLEIWDVEELPTHGGSLRVYAQHRGGPHDVSAHVSQLLGREVAAGLEAEHAYAGFAERVDRIKCDLLAFLVSERRAGRSVAAYGAAAKGNTLLNFCGVHSDLVAFCCDANPNKQGLFMPGSHIPVLPPEALRERRPDSVLVLPWNLRHEIATSHAYIGEWGGRFVVPIPELRVLGPGGSLGGNP